MRSGLLPVLSSVPAVCATPTTSEERAACPASQMATTCVLSPVSTPTRTSMSRSWATRWAGGGHGVVPRHGSWLPEPDRLGQRLRGGGGDRGRRHRLVGCGTIPASARPGVERDRGQPGRTVTTGDAAPRPTRSMPRRRHERSSPATPPPHPRPATVPSRRCASSELLEGVHSRPAPGRPTSSTASVTPHPTPCAASSAGSAPEPR